MRTMVWKAANALALAAFLFSVVVQFNDPDPIRWVVVYGAAAVACILEIKRRTPWQLPFVIGFIAFIWAGSIWGQVVGRVHFTELFEAFEMKNATVEQAREMGGLLIVGAWMAVVMAVAHTRSRAGSSVRDDGTQEIAAL